MTSQPTWEKISAAWEDWAELKKIKNKKQITDSRKEGLSCFFHEKMNREKGKKEGEVEQRSQGSTVANLPCHCFGTSASEVWDPVCCPQGSLVLDLARLKPSWTTPQKCQIYVSIAKSATLTKYTMVQWREGVVLLAEVCGWWPLGRRSITGSTSPGRCCWSGNSGKRKNPHKRDPSSQSWVVPATWLRDKASVLVSLQIWQKNFLYTWKELT